MLLMSSDRTRYIMSLKTTKITMLMHLSNLRIEIALCHSKKRDSLYRDKTQRHHH